MSDLLIIGGGFAGVWSAMASARLRDANAADVTITLITPGDDLVIRPRLYEPEPAKMRVAIERVLRPIGVERVAARAVSIEPAHHTVTVVDATGRARELRYHRLVLAAGSTLNRPDLPGAENLNDVDSLDGAVALDEHLYRLPANPNGAGRYTAVVVGAGFTGLEVATELVDRLRTIAGDHADDVRVVLVQRAATVSPELGRGPRPTILAALRDLGVEVRVNVSPDYVEPTGVRLTDGTRIPAHTTIWTAGMAASPLTQQVPGRRDTLGRLLVDRYLRVPESPDVFAAGDTAAADTGSGELTLQSCQYAIPLGRYAGHNATASLLGAPMLPFAPEPYVTCLDLGSAGGVFTTGFNRVVRRSGQPAKDIKRVINEQRIYPPFDDRDAILHAGDPARTWADAGPVPHPRP
jgi:NADH dehydrogenase